MATKLSSLPPNLRREKERKIRLKISKLLKESQGMMRGTLFESPRTCGSSSCKCLRGEKHKSLYLKQSKNGKVRNLYIRKDWEDDVRQWVANYQIMNQLLEELSDTWWQNVKKREY